MTDSQLGNGASSVPNNKLRTVLITYFPMFIATLSLVTSIFNGYLNAKFVGIIQGNLSRAEYMRSCRDAVDAYFQVKFRAQVISRNSQASPSSDGAMTPAQVEGANAVAHMAALGTYLANLRGEQVRAHYTDLSAAIDKAMNEASKLSPAELRKLFEPADRIFADLNADCVKTALERPM
jgi:hypothetical protein